MSNQPLKINEIFNKPSLSSTVGIVSTSPLSLPRKSNRHLFSYTSPAKKAVLLYIMIKNNNKGRDVEVKTMPIKELKETVHKAKKKKVNKICRNSYI